MLGIVLGTEDTPINQTMFLPLWCSHSSRGRKVKCIASWLAINVKEKTTQGGENRVLFFQVDQ